VLEVSTYAIGLRTRFRGLTVRTGVLLRGPLGWGEFAPFDDYDTAASVPWWHSAVEAATVGWPPPVRDRVPVNVTVPACTPERAVAIVAAASGAHTAKVKVAEVGQDLRQDLARVAAVRDALGRTGRIRVDANGGWPDPGAAAAAIVARDREVGLEYVEQPCRTVGELAAVRRLVDVPIAADESIRRAADPLRVAREQAADIAVIKVAPLGGVAAALRLIEQLGLPVVVSSALETSVGIAAGVALAAALPELPYACGLATVALLERDVCADPLLPVDGYLPVRPAVPDPAASAAVAAPHDVTVAWQQRVNAVRDAAAAGGSAR
jgi:O-succinylbenzoate synthase